MAFQNKFTFWPVTKHVYPMCIEALTLLHHLLAATSVTAQNLNHSDVQTLSHTINSYWTKSLDFFSILINRIIHHHANPVLTGNNYCYSHQVLFGFLISKETLLIFYPVWKGFFVRSVFGFINFPLVFLSKSVKISLKIE